MASQPQQSGHLDATTGRDVVYCHACSHEWYRDEGGLECPHCRSDVTEIISPENDPRSFEAGDLDSDESLDLSFHHPDEEDTDPDVADIDEVNDHIGPDGMYHRHTTRSGPGAGRSAEANGYTDPVLARFLNMVQNFGPPQAPGQTRTEDNERDDPGTGTADESRPGFTQRSYVRRFGGGTASVTIFSGQYAPPHREGGNAAPPDDPFQSIFSGILRDLGPPGQRPAATGGAHEGFARGLQDILSLFNPANAVAGDAVYTQEALDRIITNLMEANPQSHAAPPATEQGLAQLDRRTVDAELLKGESNTECTICQDEFKVDETVAFLPCKHWFHDDCVVPWLKAHNTCPICRAPIEDAPNSNTNETERERDASAYMAGRGFEPEMASYTNRPRPAWMDQQNQTTGVTTGYAARPPNQSQSRLNEALRNISSIQRDRAATPDFSYDTSRLQRRSSHSPTSPRIRGPGDYASRIRQRSPSESSRRADRDRDRDDDSQQQAGGGGGAINWLRDRFGGGGSSRGARDGR